MHLYQPYHTLSPDPKMQNTRPYPILNTSCISSLPILAEKWAKGRSLGVKADFLHSDPGDLVDTPQKSPHESHGGGFPKFKMATIGGLNSLNRHNL